MNEIHEEWRIQGECNENSPDCDHFGDHGPWVCEAIFDSREEAEAAPIARSPDAYIVRRLVSNWERPGAINSIDNH